MAEQPLRAALRHLCDAAGGRAAETAPDGELLRRFVWLRDGAAFAALVPDAEGAARIRPGAHAPA